MPSAPIRYFLAADRLTQCAVPMTDLLHRMIWGVATYGSAPWSEPFGNPEMVYPADPLEWLERQLAVRLGVENAAERIAKVRAGEAQMAEAA